MLTNIANEIANARLPAKICLALFIVATSGLRCGCSV
jgi:hypothetical protein